MSQYTPQSAMEDATRVRDMEEKHRLLKDRVLLIGKTLIDEKERSSLELREIKSLVYAIKEEHDRIKELLERVVEQMNSSARKEDLLILQRQLDLLRKDN